MPPPVSGAAKHVENVKHVERQCPCPMTSGPSPPALWSVGGRPPIPSCCGGRTGSACRPWSWSRRQDLATTRPRSPARRSSPRSTTCLLYTSDAADDLLCVDLGGRRILKNKNKTPT